MVRAHSLNIPGMSRLRALTRHPLFPLLLITLLGGVLRLLLLWRPAFWIDEAAVYRRVCGSLSDMMDRVADSGFTPLHYLMEWAIKQVAPMTPFVMRLPTALAGTAMVPVMYWLTAQILASRRTAMLVALFTACGSYVLAYSRDAKMYIECWMFVALCTACLLWWLSSQRWIAWGCWLLSGVIMLGLHGTAAMILPVQAIIFVTHPKLHWKRAIPFVLGIVLIVSPAVVYYSRFNHYPDRVRKDWGSSGLTWIESANDDRDALQLLRLTGATFLVAWEWPAGHDAQLVDRRVLRFCTTSAIVMFAIIGLGAFPWRRPESLSRPVSWRAMLWIGAWVILPVYGVYRTSSHDAWPPWRWFSVITEHPWWSVLSAAMIAFALWLRSENARQGLRKLAVIAGVSAGLLALCVIVYLVVPTLPTSVWMPRYLGVAWPAFAIAVSALLMRLPTRPIRWTAIALVIAFSLARHVAFIGPVWCEPPVETIAADILAGRGGAGATTRTYLGVHNRWLMGPADRFFTPVLPYYLYALGHSSVRSSEYPTRWSGEFQVRRLTFPTNVVAPPDLARDDTRPASLRRIIIWHEWAPLGAAQRDALLTKLGPEWKLAGEQTWQIYDRWNWKQNFQISRRVYERK
jgi:hypothetical protein